ncbi:MAG: Gldg family protein [Muribaculaceae bacterium]|nr:Gldg family protein [Muribaculaceae bacterium]
MIAIYKREVQSFFHSMIGWLFLAVTLFIQGLYFTVYNIVYGYPNTSVVLQGALFIFLMMMPILTMRSIAEDRKLKTDQLILTAPVTVGRIVLGKYLALLTVFAVPVVIIGVTPLLLSFTGSFQMAVSYTALLGFILYGALALAIGLFLSSLTENVVIAAVLAFVVLFLGYMMSGLCSLISTTGNVLTRALSAFDMVGRFDEMAGGSLYVPSVVYYLSLIFFLLFCTKQSIQKRRYGVSGKGKKVGVCNLSAVIAALVLTILVNVGVGMLPGKFLSFDMTTNKLYTLTKDTENFVKGLSEDLTIYVLASESGMDSNLDKMIRKIETLSEHITVSYVDPSVNPLFYSNYTETAPSSNSLIVTGPQRSRVIDYNDIYVYEMDYASYQSQITGYDGEGQIVSAFAYVTTDDMPRIYGITGHGELALEGQFEQAVQKENVEYQELSLLTVEEIPEDAQAIILNAPTADYSSDDADKVLAFLEKGGNAVIIPTWTGESMPNFERILAYYGVSIEEGMIVEGDNSKYYSNPFCLFPQINYDELTVSVFDAAVFAPFTQGIIYDEETQDISYVPLLETSEASYSKVDVETATDYTKSEEDIDGPFVIALKAEKNVQDNAVSDVVIVATEQMFSESADSVVPGNNLKLFGNVISSLVEHESSILIPVKYYDANLLSFRARTCIVIGVLTILVMPVASLAVGFVIWFLRKRR